MNSIVEVILEAGFHVSVNDGVASTGLHCVSPSPGSRYLVMITELTDANDSMVLKKNLEFIEGVFACSVDLNTSTAAVSSRHHCDYSFMAKGNHFHRHHRHHVSMQ